MTLAVSMCMRSRQIKKLNGQHFQNGDNRGYNATTRCACIHACTATTDKVSVGEERGAVGGGIRKPVHHLGQETGHFRVHGRRHDAAKSADEGHARRVGLVSRQPSRHGVRHLRHSHTIHHDGAGGGVRHVHPSVSHQAHAGDLRNEDLVARANRHGIADLDVAREKVGPVVDVGHICAGTATEVTGFAGEEVVGGGHRDVGTGAGGDMDKGGGLPWAAGGEHEDGAVGQGTILGDGKHLVTELKLGHGFGGSRLQGDGGGA